MRAWWTAAVLAAAMIAVLTSCGPAAPPRPAAAEASAPLALRGVVLDETGAPAPGALVVLDHERTTTTDASGAFGFDDVAPGSRAVYARLDVRRTAVLGVVPRADRGPITLSLRHTGVVEVTFIDEAGAEIRDVAVELGGFPAPARADGRVELAHGDQAIARAPGFAAAFIVAPGLAEPGARSERTVVLVPGAPLSGTVVDTSGAPVADASVWLRVLHRDGLTDEVKTDAAGRWTFPAVPTSGRAELRAWINGPALTEIDLAAPGSPVLHVQSTEVARVRGVVVDEVGRAVEGATVHTLDGSTVSDATGRFELDTASSFARALAVRGELASAAIDLDEVPSGEELRLVLRPAHVRGVLVDARGAPVSGAQLLVRAPFVWQHPGNAYWDVTDVDGTFSLGPSLRDELDVSITLDAAGPAPGLPFPATLRRRDLAARLVVPATTELRAVVTLDGAPVRRYAIQLAQTSTYERDEPERIAGPMELIASEDGVLRRAGIPLGEWTVHIVGNDFVEWSYVIEARPGRVVDLGEVKVARGRTLRGRVTDGTGAPRAGVDVVAGRRTDAVIAYLPIDPWMLARLELGVARTDADGRFELHHLSGGKLKVQAHDGAWHSPVVDVTADDVTLVLAPPAAADGGAP